jgi:hypothetical protein
MTLCMSLLLIVPQRYFGRIHPKRESGLMIPSPKWSVHCTSQANLDLCEADTRPALITRDLKKSGGGCTSGARCQIVPLSN